MQTVETLQNQTRALRRKVHCAIINDLHKGKCSQLFEKLLQCSCPEATRRQVDSLLDSLHVDELLDVLDELNRCQPFPVPPTAKHPGFLSVGDRVRCKGKEITVKKIDRVRPGRKEGQDVPQMPWSEVTHYAVIEYDLPGETFGYWARGYEVKPLHSTNDLVTEAAL